MWTCIPSFMKIGWSVFKISCKQTDTQRDRQTFTPTHTLILETPHRALIKYIPFFCCELKVNFVTFYERITGRVRDKSECDLYSSPPVKSSWGSIKNAFKLIPAFLNVCIFVLCFIGIHHRHQFRQAETSKSRTITKYIKHACAKPKSICCRWH